jgi:subfamily B ATP-binding cassette protein MsbA
MGDKERKNSSIGIYFRLLSYVRPYAWIFALSIAGYAVFAASQPAFAKLVEYFIQGLEGTSETLMYFVPLAGLAIAVLRGIGSYLGNYNLAKVSNSVVHDLRVDLFNKLLVLPNRYIDHHNSGYLISKITYNVTLVTSAATDAIKVVIREGLTVIFLLTYLFWTNWKLTLVFLAVAPVIAILVSIVGKRLRGLSHKIQDAMGQVTHVTSETIHGFQVVRSYGGEEYEKERFLAASLRNLKKGLKMVKVSAINTPVLQFLVVLAMAVVMFLVLYMRDTTSTAALVSFVVATGFLPKPIRQLSEVHGNIQKGIAACETIFEQLDETPEEDPGRHAVERVEGLVELRQLGFHYPGSEKEVLNSIDLEVRPGEMIALVGRSGSGKTTITNLLLRFYNHTSGEILIDGVSIRDYDLRNLRQQIALVGQNVALFNDTVANNIAYGQANADQGRIEAAARAAHAMEFIQELPDGLQTLIGENGVMLSGGQRQRLAIARAFMKDAPILVLDEATSALDNESERYIQEALKELTRGRTTIVIAHRLSTIEHADRILVMKSGSIVESGTHAQLLAGGGEYAFLYQSQFQAKEQSLESEQGEA